MKTVKGEEGSLELETPNPRDQDADRCLRVVHEMPVRIAEALWVLYPKYFNEKGCF